MGFFYYSSSVISYYPIYRFSRELAFYVLHFTSLYEITRTLSGKNSNPTRPKTRMETTSPESLISSLREPRNSRLGQLGSLLLHAERVSVSLD